METVIGGIAGILRLAGPLRDGRDILCLFWLDAGNHGALPGDFGHAGSDRGDGEQGDQQQRQQRHA